MEKVHGRAEIRNYYISTTINTKWEKLSMIGAVETVIEADGQQKIE